MTSWVSTNNKRFLFSEKLHDVTFEFTSEGVRIPAHAMILSFASEVFEAQLCGSMKEREITVEDASSDDFRTFLRFIYTGELLLSLENIFKIGYLSDKYMIPELTRRVADFYVENIRVDDHLLKLFCPSCITFFDDGEKRLLGKLMNRILEDPLKFIKSEEFLDLDSEAVGLIVQSEQIAVNEFDISAAVVRWAKHQCERVQQSPACSNMRVFVKDFIFSIRLPTFTVNQLISTDGIFSSEFLSSNEKTSLVRYCGGDTCVSIPFSKLPRLHSLDTLAPEATSQGSLISDPVSCTFTPQANYRFIGVGCCLDLEDNGGTPAVIDFEIRDQDKIICQFNWTADCRMEVADRYFNCMASDVYHLFANRNYTLTVSPGPGVHFHVYNGNYCKDDTSFLNTANAQDMWPIKSFLLLNV